MALQLIGDKYGLNVLDIHAGGVDLIFPHHEDEIAQSCAYTGEANFARIWMHGEFLNVRGQKMSKRYGNYTTPRDLREDGVDAGAIRLLFFQTHYRQKLDLTDEALAAAREGARRLGGFARRLQDASDEDSPEFVELAGRLDTAFREALNDDLNAPRAVAAAFEFVSEGNRLLDQGIRPGARALAAWHLVDRVLDASTEVKFTTTGAGLDLKAMAALPDAPPSGTEEGLTWARQWAEMRVIAKARRDFAEADRIRKLLTDHGFEVRDTRNGSEVVRR
jgi:cysteinyl-tRNA synthetase